MIRKRDKFQLIKVLSKKYPIKLLCEIASVSYSGYYKWLSRKAVADTETEIKNLILYIYHDSKKRFGYRRVYIELRETYGLKINHKRVYRLMTAMGIKSIVRKKKFKYPRKNDKTKKYIKENILNREFNANKPNEKWSTDITYLYYGSRNQHRAYLSAIKDLCTNEIVSFKLNTHYEVSLVKDTICDAIKYMRTDEKRGLLIHSDQGCQYTCKEYISLLEENEITQSMSRKGNCYDNAPIENFFGHLKCEETKVNKYITFSELVNAITEYIYWYNNSRKQQVLKNLTPAKYRCQIQAA